MKNHIAKIALLLSLLICGQLVNAQEPDDKGQSKKVELAKMLANPNSTLGFFGIPIDYVTYQGDLPGANSQSAFKINFQPSLPYPIGEGVNLFVRPLLPIIIKQPTITENGFENSGVELGDLAFDVAIGKTWSSNWVTIGGLFGSAPTATSDALGVGQWTLGPNVFLGKVTKWGFVGSLVNHSWGLSGGDGNKLSVTGGQYMYAINIKDAWQIQAQPTFSYNHNAEDGNKLTLPIGIGVSNMYLLGKLPVKLNFQYWYYAASPDSFGPQSTFRFQIIPIIPLPW